MRFIAVVNVLVLLLLLLLSVDVFIIFLNFINITSRITIVLNITLTHYLNIQPTILYILLPTHHLNINLTLQPILLYPSHYIFYLTLLNILSQIMIPLNNLIQWSLYQLSLVVLFIHLTKLYHSL